MQIVTTHRGTDFDALASVIAATIIYPGAVPILPRNINPNVKAFVSMHKDLLNIHTVEEIDLATVQRLIVVDVNSWQRLESLNGLEQRSDLEIIVWDHHSMQGDIQATWKKPHASSTFDG